MGPFQDFKARYPWSEEALAADALKVRLDYGYLDNALAFDIWECFRRLSFTRTVPVHELRPEDPRAPAFVQFEADNPTGLHITRAARVAAEKGEGDGRGIVAHEIAHLRLHRDGLNSFSPYSPRDGNWMTPEWSIEWQACTWTGHFLLPDLIVSTFSAPDEIVEMCKVDAETATIRLAQWNDKQRRRAASSLCSCGSFKFVDASGSHVCPFC
jgi:hypothetical protein